MSPPLDPPNDEAHRWLADELSKNKYDTPWSLLDWLGRLINRLLPNQAGGLGVPGWVIPTVTVVVLALAVLVVIRAGRTQYRRSSKGGALVDDPSLTAADYRRLSAEAEAAGDWDTVALQSFRAIAVHAVERTLLDEAPGRTAHEVAVELAPVFPTFAKELVGAADVFDVVRYAGRSTTRSAASAVRTLDDDTRRARPVLPSVESVEEPA
jgi:hypothetical protein